MPLMTSMIELGQFPHTPPRRMRATPSETSSTSNMVPSISKAGPTCCASAAATRDFRFSDEDAVDTEHLLARSSANSSVDPSVISSWDLGWHRQECLCHRKSQCRQTPRYK